MCHEFLLVRIFFSFPVCYLNRWLQELYALITKMCAESNPEYIFTDRQFVVSHSQETNTIKLEPGECTLHLLYNVAFMKNKPLKFCCFGKYYSIWSFQLRRVFTIKKGAGKLCLKSAADFNLTLTFSLFPNLGYQGIQEELEQLAWRGLRRHMKVWAVSSYFLADTERCTMGRTSKNSSVWDFKACQCVRLCHIQPISAWKRCFHIPSVRFSAFTSKSFEVSLRIVSSEAASPPFYLDANIFSFRGGMTVSSVKTIINPRVRDQSENNLVQRNRSIHTWLCCESRLNFSSFLCMLFWVPPICFHTICIYRLLYLT